MTENQNNPQSPATDSRTNQSSTQDGNKKETNPNNPVAGQSTPAGKEQPSGKGQSDTDVEETEDNEEKTITAGKTGNTESKKSETGNQTSNKGSI